MIPISLDLPDTQRELAAWLESHLLGMQLGDLVAELRAVHGDPADGSSLEQVCGEQLDDVLKFGLGRLELNQLRHFLQHPQHLLSLQDEIVQRGGDYWMRRPLRREEEVALASQWKLLESVMSPAVRTPAPTTTRRSWLSQSVITALLSSAATLAVAFALRDRFVPAPAAGWGWEKPGALAVNLPPREYLNHLADAAQDWFKQRPENAPNLARRISQFRQGCSTLILAEHPILAPADRDWLRERCRAWATKLDGHLAAIEAGEDVTTVRAAADETVKKLIKAIHDRAQSIS
jgi:hypothetical protein